MQKCIEIIEESIITLTLNKMRTALAILGVVIGIGSVIALVSLGQASQKSVSNQITSLGSNLLTVSPTGNRSAQVRGAMGSGVTLTLDDANSLGNNTTITSVKQFSPEYQGRSQVVAGRNNTNTQILGVTPAYMDVRKVVITSGVFISDYDLSGMTKVCVLGPQVVSDLFYEGATPIGEDVKINGSSFRIVGITKSKGGQGFQNQDDVVYIPLTTAQKIIFGVNYLTSISVEAKSEDLMDIAQNEVGYALMARHNIKDPVLSDFTIFSQNQILSAASSVSSTFTTLLSGIAAISLIVGGIGIMNIMLVTVTERTREIGLRKALGATKKTVIVQFLIEAVLLTAAGGIMGILVGIATSLIISYFMSMPFVISLPSVFLAIGVSAGIGILFGWYPAKKASELLPIEALRYE